MTCLTALSRDCTALAVLAAGILEGGDDMADSTVKKLDYKYT